MKDSRLSKLNALRGFAALYVIAVHVFLSGRIGNEPWFAVFKLGPEALMFFFLFSGFLIHYSFQNNPDKTFRSYFLRRFRRIYPIYLLALAVSYASGRISGMQPPDFKQLVGNLLMFQDYYGGNPGVYVPTFCGNFPLWSLSYEWWFYMMFFPIQKYVPASRQLLFVSSLSAVGLGSYFLFPNQVSLFLMYFVIWWAGVELAKAFMTGASPGFRNQWRSLLIMAGFCLVLLIPVVRVADERGEFLWRTHPGLQLRHFVAGLISLAVGLTWAEWKWRYFDRVFRVFAIFAPISYALYVFHYPLAVTASYLKEVGSRPLEILGYIAVTFGLAWLAEVPFQNWINRRLSPKPASKPAPLAPFRPAGP